jgi:hypothetical protein
MPEETQKPNTQNLTSATMSGQAKPARDKELEILERKLKAMIALGEEALNRLKELKAA